MRLNRRETLAGLAAATAAASFAAPGAQAAGLPRNVRPLERNETFPDVAFRDATGADQGFVELRGKPAIATFWATWCTVCYGEMPKLDRLQAMAGDRVHLRPLSIDRAGMPAVQAYYAKRGFRSLQPYIDPEMIFASIMGIRGVPTSFILDSQGRMAAVVQGAADWDSQEMVDYLMTLA